MSDPNQGEQIQASLDAVDAEIQREQTLVAPFMERLTKLYEQRRILGEERDKLRVIDLAANPDWKMLLKDLATDERCSVALLRWAEDELYNKYSFYHSGHWTDTNESNLRLILENTPFCEERVLGGIRFFVPLMEPHENGRVWFTVFGTDDAFRLEMKPDFSEIVLTNDRGSVIREFPILASAVKYIRDNYGYK